MALFREGMACPLCKEPMQRRQSLFGTWGVWLPSSDPLHRYCDAYMHWECYATWKYRGRFARSYFEFWIEHEKTSPYWTRAYLDNFVLVTVNPITSVSAAWVHLADTGSRSYVLLTEWERWLHEAQSDADHRVEAESMRQAQAILRNQMPTRALLLQHADFERKRPLTQLVLEEQLQRAARQVDKNDEMKQHNERCRKVMSRVERVGMACEHCGQTPSEFRLSQRAGQRSLVICRRCGWVVDVPEKD